MALKNELIFTALSEPVNIKSNIYGDILKHLSKRFNKIHVICLGKENIKKEGNIIYQSGKLRHWFKFFNNINKTKISHIFITDFFVGGLISTFQSKKHKIPLIYRCGGPWKYPLNSPIRIIKALTLKITKPIVIKACQKIVYNSKSIIQNYLHNYEVIHNGVDTTLFKPIKQKKLTQKLNLLYIGRILHEKGTNYLLKAIQNENIHLSIVGDGNQTKEYQKQYPKVKFYGRVKKEALPKIINQHDILILPSLVESFPNVLLEAMACKLPVIATNIFGIPEMITNQHNGLLIPPKNTPAIKHAIHYFIKNPK
ncbi:glycosyltransferase family 4 protein, partial [Candidatus Woesearchaeota archaeon]|nr:glycosyltransferase family 4 protein [Candidatus Woesearchaeota archaeon]